MTTTIHGNPPLTTRHYPTRRTVNMKLVPTKPFQNLQNKTITLDMTVNMFIDDWVDNNKKSLLNGTVTDEDQYKLLQEISLNIGCWSPIVLMNNRKVDDEGMETYQIIHGSSLLNTLIDFREDKFKLSCEERDWIQSRKIRVIVYDDLTPDESAALFKHSDMFKTLQQQDERLAVLDIEGRVFEGHE